MLIRSILTIAVLGSFVFGAAANAAGTEAPSTSLTAQIDGVVAGPSVTTRGTFASDGGLGGTR